MNKTELIKAVATAVKEHGITKANTEIIIDTIFDVMTTAFSQGEDVKLNGFGSFTIKERSARQVRSLQDNELISVPATQYVHFKQSAALKSMLND